MPLERIRYQSFYELRKGEFTEQTLSRLKLFCLAHLAWGQEVAVTEYLVCGLFERYVGTLIVKKS